MNRLAYLLSRAIVNPPRANAYSRLLEARGPVATEPYTSSAEFLLLYLAALIPLWIGAVLGGASGEQILLFSSCILTVGLLLGSIHLTLGLVSVLALSALSILNIGFVLPTAPSGEALWRIVPLLVVLPIALALQALANSGQGIYRVWRLVWILAVGAASVGLAYLDAGGMPYLHLWATLMVGGLAAAAFTRTAAGSNDMDAVGFVGLLMLVTGGIGAGWQLYPALFSPNQTAWLNTVLQIGFTIVTLVVAAGTGFMLIGMEVDAKTSILAPRRLLLFGAFAVLAYPYEVPQALLAALAAVALYSLTFPALNLMQEEFGEGIHITAITASAVLCTVVAGAIILIPGWREALLSLLSALPNPDPAWYPAFPWLMLAGSALVFTISGYHWSTPVFAILMGLLIILAYWLRWTSFPLSSFLIVGSVAGGAVIGATRVLLWPALSAAAALGARQVQRRESIPAKAPIPAVDLIDCYSLPAPAGRDALLDALVHKGLSPDAFATERGRRLYRKAQVRVVTGMVAAAQSLDQVLKIPTAWLSPRLDKAIKSLRTAWRVSSEFDRTRAYAVAIKEIEATVAAGPKEATARRRAITEPEIEALERVIDVAYQDIRPSVEVYWSAYDAFPELALKSERETEAELVARGLEGREALRTGTSYHVEQIARIAKGMEPVRPYLDRLPANEQETFSAIVEVRGQVGELLREVDYQAQGRGLQETRLRLDRIRANLPATWQAIHREANQVEEHANPWVPLVNAMNRHLVDLAQLNEQFLKWTAAEVAGALEGIHSAEELSELARRLRPLIAFGERYDPILDVSLQALEEISREAAAAIAFPKGYSRRLGLQDTLDLVNKLRNDLSIRYLQEASGLVEPLGQIAGMLHAELYAEAEVEKGAYRNPYIAGNPIRLRRAALFKGRRELAEQIVTVLRSGGNPTLILYGPRRMGKTSFLLQLPQLLPSKYAPVFMDMQKGGAAQNEANFAYALARAIYLQLRRDFDLSQPELSEYEAHPYVSLDGWLDDVMPLLEDRILVLTIDEFEAIGRGIREGRLSEQVLGHLRHLMQHNENLILMFAGVQTIEGLGPNPASYFISAYPVEIGYLHEKEAEELIRNPDPDYGRMPSYDDEVVAGLLHLTHCQPYLIQAICTEIIDLANTQSLAEIGKGTLDEAVAKVLSSSLYFENIWHDAGEKGSELLQSLAGGPLPLDEEQVGRQVLTDLLHRRVIHRLDDGAYEIEIPLVREWIQFKFKVS